MYNFSRAPLIISVWKLLLNKKYIRKVYSKSKFPGIGISLKAKFQVYKFRPFLSKRRPKFYNRDLLEDSHILKSKKSEMVVLISIKNTLFRDGSQLHFYQ